MDAKQEFERASRLIKSEMARFEEERVLDFKNSLEDFLEGMISRQKEVRCAHCTEQTSTHQFCMAVDRFLGELPGASAQESQCGAASSESERP